MMVQIDGSFGEGGGQILRTALGLSLATGKAFRIYDIRAGRKNPGLRSQHLACVRAARTIGNAGCSGDSIGSRELEFHPGKVAHGSYSFDVGTAGSATLVLQTVIPALIATDGETAIEVTGGTHNAFAPPYDFFANAFSPLLRRIGITIRSSILKYGFYPAGGGRIEATVSGPANKEAFVLRERGNLVKAEARAVVANLGEDITDSEIRKVIEELDSQEILTSAERVRSAGPGNAVTITLAYESVTDVFTGFGERGKHRDSVAAEAIDEANAYISSGAPVGKHLADQLLVPLALGGGGCFVTSEPTLHTKTNAEVIRMFLDAGINMRPIDGDRFEITVEV